MKLFKSITLLLLSSLALSSVSYGSDSLVCSTPRGQHNFVIHQNRIAFVEKRDMYTRQVASTTEYSLTSKRGNQVTQVFRRGKMRVTIHVGDITNPNAFEDYMTMKDENGHEIMFPIECENS